MARKKAKNRPAAASVRQASVQDLAAALEGDDPPLVVDVRTPMEFGGGHVPGAVNVPLDRFGRVLADPDGPLANRRDLWVVCRSGGRSSQAANMAKQAGRSATNVAGGTMAWRGAGFDTEPAGTGGPDLTMPVLASATLGLAPFTPEPHLVEKLRWLATGQPFAAIDVFDLLMHGAPFMWLAWTLWRRYGPKASA